MNNIDFISKLDDVLKHNTLYVMGCFGSPLINKNVNRYCNNHDYNKSPKRTAKIKEVANKLPVTYGFDCAGLVKGILWGWDAVSDSNYGGAVYKSNDVPDINADSLIKSCVDVSTDFSNIVAGALVWIKGHVGIYKGDGIVIECTPEWSDGVQMTMLENNGYYNGNSRTWTKWGKLPYIDYVDFNNTELDKCKALMLELGYKVKAESVKEITFIKGCDIDSLKIGDVITLRPNATYYTGKSIPAWIFDKILYYRGTNKNGVIFSTEKKGAVTGVVTSDMII